MATLKEQFGTAAQVITITLASLASGAWRQGVFVDNTTNLFTEVLVQLQAKTAGTAAGTVDLWCYGSVDNGVTYSDGATGLDAAFTPTATPNMVHLGTLNTPAINTAYTSPIFSVSFAFGSTIPLKWGIACKNTNGGALDATGANFVLQYQGQTYQSA